MQSVETLESPERVRALHRVANSRWGLERYCGDRLGVGVLSVSGGAMVRTFRNPAPAARERAVGSASPSTRESAGLELASSERFRRCATTNDRIRPTVLAAYRGPDRSRNVVLVDQAYECQIGRRAGRISAPHGHDGKPTSIHDRAIRTV